MAPLSTGDPPAASRSRLALLGSLPSPSRLRLLRASLREDPLIRHLPCCSRKVAPRRTARRLFMLPDVASCHPGQPLCSVVASPVLRCAVAIGAVATLQERPLGVIALRSPETDMSANDAIPSADGVIPSANYASANSVVVPPPSWHPRPPPSWHPRPPRAGAFGLPELAPSASPELAPSVSDYFDDYTHAYLNPANLTDYGDAEITDTPSSGGAMDFHFDDYDHDDDHDPRRRLRRPR